MRFDYLFRLFRLRGATALLVYSRCNAGCNSQLVPINAHATWQPRSVDRTEWRPKGRHEVITALQLCQHGDFWHESVSERQRSRPCGQNLCVPLLRTVLPPEVGESARAMAATARQKRWYLHHQGEFQHNYYTFV